MGVCETNKIPDTDWKAFSSKKRKDLILARVPRSEYLKLSSVNKRFLSLIKSNEIFKMRKEIGFTEQSVFILATGEENWLAFDRKFKSPRKLPILPSDFCFTSVGKESLCAGTHLLVTGKELDGFVIWTYKLATNRWFKGSSMVNPRCKFASATDGTFGYVAGGIGIESGREILGSAEKYNPDDGSWEPLPNMHKKRSSCSGCFLDDKFYVIGGRNEEEGNLRCGEAFDEEENTWELIPNMLPNVGVSEAQCPPLVAVVNNQLYYVEACENEIMVFMKKTKSWKKLGGVPVRADCNRGWGVAFKSLGNELLAIGASSDCYACHSMTVYTCFPDPEAMKLQWKLLECGGMNRLRNFIKNCCVMTA
ncbi:hypothetical protein FNV43_RR22315 [Rhamnella rubrinervis]|uniref:F-box domain-containing protein n=1 Tax=Rhamnella rubrinervis TaxID=2594499 RepID=A0A8K0DVY8_9ROSA|nr:hypothetical protein FNV43_RR22315 [Rhamnella rubrinervis]